MAKGFNNSLDGSVAASTKAFNWYCMFRAGWPVDTIRAMDDPKKKDIKNDPNSKEYWAKWRAVKRLEMQARTDSDGNITKPLLVRDVTKAKEQVSQGKGHKPTKAQSAAMDNESTSPTPYTRKDPRDAEIAELKEQLAELLALVKK